MKKRTLLPILLLVGCQVTTTKPTFNEKTTTYQKDETTEVLLDKTLSKKDIVSYYAHGDHYHVITKDGKEHIIYKNPETLTDNESFVSVISLEDAKKQNITTIKKHGDHYHLYDAIGKEYITYEDPTALFKNIQVQTYTQSHAPVTNKQPKLDVVKILKHGDHYHLYTKNGDEFISYQDPSKKYKNIQILEYKQSHSPKQTLHVTQILGKKAADIQNIVRIAKHEDHYHIYDKDGNESIVYEDPSIKFPNIQVEEYHDTHNTENVAFTWPKNITKIIDHQDHWHLYENDKEIAVVKKNPYSHYPNAEVIKEEILSNVTVNENELFTYEEIEPAFNAEIIPYLSNNIKAMTNYGSIHSAIPVFGSNGAIENVFYWLHNDHYHAITIQQLIQKAKAHEFGKFSAQQVVALLKYKFLHPETTLEVQPTLTFEEVKPFLMKHYQIQDKRDVVLIYSNIAVYKNNQTITLPLSHFHKQNDTIQYKETLPSFKEESTITNTPTENTEIPKVNKPVVDDSAQEQANLEKIAEILEISVDDAFDVIYDIIDDQSFRIAELQINPDNTISLNDRTYPIIKPVE